MKRRIKVKPATGLLCRKPVADGGALLKPEGEIVKFSTYWSRRIKAGDVVEVAINAPKPKTEPKTEPKPKMAPKAIKEQ